jgi:hypothetical protein
LSYIDTMDQSWRAVLVDSFCQAGKTRKCFEVLNEKLRKEKTKKVLVIFITQANSVAGASQTLQRAALSKDVTEHIPVGNIFKSSAAPRDGVIGGNYMIVDYWNSRNMSNMLDFAKDNRTMFRSVYVIIDECEQGHLKGLKERLSFVQKIEKTMRLAVVKIIFITATVANLSKSVLQLKFSSGVVSEIINNPVVEHQFAEPHPSYVGASWFIDTPGVWKRLIFPKREAEQTKEQFNIANNVVLVEAIKALPDAAKELTLIVTSTRTCEHKSLAERLYRSGYNVMVELNGTNFKNYRVHYVDKSGGISLWEVPYKELDAKADQGRLARYRNENKKMVKSGIECKDDYTMSHVLQAALFMMTDAEARIQEHVSDDEFRKLEALGYAIDARRPEDYPVVPRVALIAGHLAGRGITIQNPQVDFTCTSFCFTDTRDALQRGASNTQRFGRACGHLMDVFARSGRKPILIATEGIMKDALANEAVLREKASAIVNGSLISLSDLVTKADWTRIMKETKDRMKGDERRHRHDPNAVLIDGVSVEALNHYFKSKNLLVGKMIRFLYAQDRAVTFEEFKQGIGYEKSDKQFMSNLQSGRSLNSRYGKLWAVSSSNIYINESVKEYLNKL